MELPDASIHYSLYLQPRTDGDATFLHYIKSLIGVVLFYNALIRLQESSADHQRPGQYTDIRSYYLRLSTRTYMAYKAEATNACH